MRVLLPTIRDPGQIGGMSTHLQMLSSGLEESGNQPFVLYLGGVLPRGVGKAAIVWPAGALNRVRRGWGMVYAAAVRGRLLAALTERELKRARADGEPWEVLNAQDVYSIPALRAVADRYEIPLVLTLHGYPLYESMSEGYSRASAAGLSFLMESEIRALRLADSVVTVDSRLHRHVLRIAPELASRTSLLMNFIDTSSYRPSFEGRRELRDAWDVPADKTVLFCPRRLVKKNGVVYPALALAAMPPEQRAQFLLLYAGEGGERQAIERVVREHGMQREVRLLGGQSREAVLELYLLADIVLVPSVPSENVEEATSLSALEAMACGRPVIAGAVGGLAEMIDDGETGLLVPASDPEALADAMLRLADDPQLGSRLAEAARSYVVRKHSHVQAAARFVEVYRAAALSDRGSSTSRSGGSPEFPVVSVLGSPMHQVGFEEAVATVTGWARRPSGRAGQAVEPARAGRGTEARTRVATAFNPELAVRAQDDPRVTEALLAADLRYPDGVGVVWAAGRRGAVGLERVPGVELAARVIEGLAADDLSVYLLGAAPGVAEAAAEALTAKLPGLKVAGCRHGYFTRAEEQGIVAEIRESGAAALLVALGTPRQQLFIQRHRDDLGVRVALGVGGSFDVWSGRVRRAPAWTRSLGVEWLYRLVTDPRRARRQVALVVFAWRALTDLSSDYHQPRG